MYKREWAVTTGNKWSEEKVKEEKWGNKWTAINGVG